VPKIKDMASHLPILSVTQMRELDKRTVVEDIPLLTLMENAGRSAFEFYLEKWDDSPMHLMIGKGHNGADGIVMARWAAVHGINATLYGQKNELGKIAKIQWRLAEKEGVKWSKKDYENLGDKNGVVVDCLLGTGTKGKPKESYSAWISAANKATFKGRMALDSPSGINMDDGSKEGVAFKADLTVTFAYLKPGLLLNPGRKYSGEICIAYIGIPTKLDFKPMGYMPNKSSIKNMLIDFPNDGHKGTAGRLGLWAGSKKYPGAARLAIEGALRSGVGVVHWIGESKDVPPEIVRETESISNVRKMNAWTIGPGLGRNATIAKTIKSQLQKINCPAVVDADALTAFSGKENPEKRLQGLGSSIGERIITPHHSEAASLLCGDVKRIESNRVEAVKTISQMSQAITLLKGSPTLISSKSEPIFFIDSGNENLATGGSGDVLSGLIGGLLAQTINPLHATIIGAWIHGRSGSILSEKGIPRQSVSASDIAESIKLAWMELNV